MIKKIASMTFAITKQPNKDYYSCNICHVYPSLANLQKSDAVSLTTVGLQY